MKIFYDAIIVDYLVNRTNEYRANILVRDNRTEKQILRQTDQPKKNYHEERVNGHTPANTVCVSSSSTPKSPAKLCSSA